MKTFLDWLNSQESSAYTRSRRACAQGIGQCASLGSPFSRSTPLNWEVEGFNKYTKKKRKKKK